MIAILLQKQLGRQVDFTICHNCKSELHYWGNSEDFSSDVKCAKCGSKMSNSNLYSNCEFSE